MKRFKHYIEYLTLIVCSFILFNIPLGLGYWLMRRLGDFVFYALQVRRKVTLDNLRTALGKEKTELELLDIAHKAYQNFAMTFLEVVCIQKYSLKKIEQIAFLDGKEHLDEGRKAGKGVVMVTGHLGCWDIMGFRILGEGYPMTYVSGGFRNEIIDRLYNRIREQKGIPVLPRRYALRGVIKSLKKNELVGIVSDQDAGRNGAFVDFFGKKTSTPKGAALFALRTGAKMVVVLDVPLEGRKKHKAIIRPVNIEKTGDEETDVYLYTQELTKIIEGIVHQYPEHYFWLHRRWKSSPLS